MRYFFAPPSSLLLIFISLFALAATEIDLLQYTYDAQYKELIRRVESHPESKILKNLIFSVNSIPQKYMVIAPQIKIYSYDIANQYLVVVNLMEQLIERDNKTKE